MELQAVRAEIKHMRSKVLRQRREIQDLQKAGIAEQIGELALDVTERLQAVEPLAIASPILSASVYGGPILRAGVSCNPIVAQKQDALSVPMSCTRLRRSK